MIVVCPQNVAVVSVTYLWAAHDTPEHSATTLMECLSKTSPIGRQASGSAEVEV